MNTVYLALYCPCVHESADAPLSIHATHEGAARAIEKHKSEQRDDFEEWAIGRQWSDENGCGFQAWSVKEMEVQP
jgi:hypothetical protein